MEAVSSHKDLKSVPQPHSGPLLGPRQGKRG